MFKIGHAHGGLGKVKVEDEQRFQVRLTKRNHFSKSLVPYKSKDRRIKLLSLYSIYYIHIGSCKFSSSFKQILHGGTIC